MAWPIARLGDIAEIVSGSTPKTTVDEYWGGDIPWVTPADLSHLKGDTITKTLRTLTDSGLASSGAKLLPAGSVLFSSRAPIGHVALTGVPMATNQGFKSFVTDESQLHAKYLFWWLRRHKEHLQNLGVGATFKEVSKAIVSEIRIPLPALPEQRRIASILDAAEMALQRRARSTESVNAMLESAIASAQEQAPVSLPLGECASIAAKLVDPRKAEYRQYPLIGSDNIEPNSGRLHSVRTVGEVAPISGKYFYESGDLLYSKIRPLLNKAALAPARGLCSADIYPLRVRKQIVRPEYLWAELRTPRFLEFADSVSNRAQMPKLNREQLFSYVVPVPSLEVQDAFAELVLGASALHKLLTQHQNGLEELLASVQDRAFRGDL